MIEKVNPSHPDKVADRIAGAIVDLAYKKIENPRIAVEVLIGHGNCHIIAETSVLLNTDDVIATVSRITGLNAAEDCFGGSTIQLSVDFRQVPQDEHLAENQAKTFKCGDNGIFKGVPTNGEERKLSEFVRALYAKYPTDGKFIYDKETNELIMCQSHATSEELYKTTCELWPKKLDGLTINPLGDWTGGTDVDTGATNRKLGSDMGRAVTGGGLHGKDLSKADVSVNIVAHILAQTWGEEVEALCAIGDGGVEFKSKDNCWPMNYNFIVLQAKKYITKLGGFEKLAEWGLL